jgi:hypothetical protein
MSTKPMPAASSARRGAAWPAGEGVDVVMGTLGKAFGAFGAYVAGSRALIDWLVNRCPASSTPRRCRRRCSAPSMPRST